MRSCIPGCVARPPSTGLRARAREAATPPPPSSPRPERPSPEPPPYLQQAYDLAYLSQLPISGSGKTIAIVDANDDPNAESDLAVYRAEFGLPACTTANGCFTKYDQNGRKNYPTTVDPGWSSRSHSISTRSRRCARTATST